MDNTHNIEHSETSLPIEFQGELGAYKLICTADGSPTLWSEKFDETCHSTHGAFEETLLHYVEGCKVLERFAKKGLVNILEVGFGLGLGFLATKKEIYSTPVQGKVHFISTEMDEKLVQWAIEEYEEDHHMANLIKSEFFGIPCYESYYNDIHLVVLIGDARVTLTDLAEKNPNYFHAIYQDAFSPKKNPELWSVEWFQSLKELAHRDVIMSTYSSSASIRKSMLEAGWTIRKGPGFGPKRESSRATLYGKTQADILKRLNASPATAIHQKDLSH